MLATAREIITHTVRGMMIATSPDISTIVITTATMVRVHAPSKAPAPIRANTPAWEMSASPVKIWVETLPTILPNKDPSNRFGTKVPAHNGNHMTKSVRGT